MLRYVTIIDNHNDCIIINTRWRWIQTPVVLNLPLNLTQKGCLVNPLRKGKGLRSYGKQILNSRSSWRLFNVSETKL